MSVINDNGRIILRSGWTAFARESNIRAGDVCKFELLDRLIMLVHMTRRLEGTRREKETAAEAKHKSLKKAVGASQHKLGCSN